MAENCQFVGPYRLEKTLGKGQTGKLLIIILIIFLGILKINVYFLVRSRQARCTLCDWKKGSH